MNSYAQVSERPGRHEVRTLAVLFASGSCAIASAFIQYAFVGAALLMVMGIIEIFRSSVWSGRVKWVSTALLLLLYVAIAAMGLVAVSPIEGDPLPQVYGLGLLGMVLGVPAGIAAWFFLVFKTIRAAA
ncbi:MAG: hypothetical protein JHC98_07705 [Thermoleophilaceae bacterium]|nr:hypothetical protein [Thermoleophilaceae bacterium]